MPARWWAGVCAYFTNPGPGTKRKHRPYILKSRRQVFLSKCISLNKLLLLNRFREMQIKIDVSHCYLGCLWYCEITELKYTERLIVINLRALRNCLKWRSQPVVTNIFVEELSLPGSNLNIVSKVNFNKETKVLISELHKSQNWFKRICFENTTISTSLGNFK